MLVRGNNSQACCELTIVEVDGDSTLDPFHVPHERDMQNLHVWFCPSPYLLLIAGVSKAKASISELSGFTPEEEQGKEGPRGPGKMVTSN